MRINHLFDFRNYNLWNQSSLVSRLLGSKNVGSRNLTNRNIASKNTMPNFMDGVVYSKGSRRAAFRPYTRQGVLEGVRPNRHPEQRKTFYSGQEILDAIGKYDGYILGYDGKSAYLQGTEYVYSNTSRYPVESRPVGEKMYFNPADVNDALGIHNPKQMSVKDNEVRFDSYSYYQFQGKDGRNHRVLSMGSSLSANTFADFQYHTSDKEAVEYADFWERLSRNSTYGLSQDYSQKEIRQKLTDAGIQNGFFTVTVGGKEYVLNEHKGIDIEYGADVYLGAV